MKKILLLICIVAAFSGKAQTIQLDTPSNTAFAQIQPVPISWLKGTPNVTRLYVKIADFNLVNNTSFNWWLKYPVMIDETTIIYEQIMGGSKTLPVNTALTIEDATDYIFNFVADSMNLNIKFAK